MRALYVGTFDMTNHATVTGTMVPLFTSTGITDVLLYMKAVDYDNKLSDIQFFLSQMSANSINVWGQEGYRGYFDDSFGPQGIYAAAQRVISWNNSNPANQRFVGF